MKSIVVIFFVIIVFSCSIDGQKGVNDSHLLPSVWTTYRKVETIEKDFANLKAHGVGLVNMNARNKEEAKEKLDLARRFGMKYNIDLPEITENARTVKGEGFLPVDALMIGGVYNGKSIDRHLFKFEAKQNTIIIEPPVYNKSFAYNISLMAKDGSTESKKVAHYFPDMPAPVKAEVIIPLKKFDGKQHLKVIKAEIIEAPIGTRPEFDSVGPEVPVTLDIESRKLYQIKFDLSGLENALLDQVGIAVYWPYHGSNKYWIFGGGNVSASASSTRQALQSAVQKKLAIWKDANNGEFPLDVVVAARLGDECFYITGHIHSGSSAVSFPLWDYSKPTIDAFYKYAGDMEYPRTWGFPEIYGEKAYGCWMYNLHSQIAFLVEIVHDEVVKVAPGLKLFRNTTRMGVFSLSNNFDGTGQELLARQLDIVHLDPYPVAENGYGNSITRDMSYCAGLSRRYSKPLIPWMQAHTYSKLQHVTPEQVERMTQEQWEQGIDGLVWLGYGPGYTFPNVRPDSWERASAFHQKLAHGLPTKLKAKLAVLRSYNKMASLSLWENNQLRNPDDWMLQQFLEVWAVQQKKTYDVFEISPCLSPKDQDKLKDELKNYQYIVSTLPWDGAWLIDDMGAGAMVSESKAAYYQQIFRTKIKESNLK